MALNQEPEGEKHDCKDRLHPQQGVRASCDAWREEINVDVSKQDSDRRRGARGTGARRGDNEDTLALAANDQGAQESAEGDAERECRVRRAAGWRRGELAKPGSVGGVAEATARARAKQEEADVEHADC